MHLPAIDAASPNAAQNGMSSSGPPPKSLPDRSSSGGTVAPMSSGRALASAAAEHLHVPRDDLGGVALLSLLVLPLAGADAPFDVDLAALGEVLARDLGGACPTPPRDATRWLPASGRSCRSSARWSRAAGSRPPARPAVKRISGFAPRLPTRITLLTPLMYVSPMRSRGGPVRGPCALRQHTPGRTSRRAGNIRRRRSIDGARRAVYAAAFDRLSSSPGRGAAR